MPAIIGPPQDAALIAQAVLVAEAHTTMTCHSGAEGLRDSGALYYEAESSSQQAVTQIVNNALADA